MCILLGAMFEMSFEDAMNSAKDIVENNNATDTTHITLAVHASQIERVSLTAYHINELQLLNETCSWKSINSNEDKCVDECSCIKLIAENAYKGAEIWEWSEWSEDWSMELTIISDTQYKEVIKELLREGNYTIMKSYLTPAELKWGVEYNQGMGWHRSEDRIHGINPNRGYLTNKKWAFIEDINIFILPLFKASKVKLSKLRLFGG